MRGTLLRASKACHCAAQVNLEPGAEVHRIRLPRHANVAEIAGAVPCRNVEASAKRDGQVHVIAADPDPLAKHLQRGAIGPGLHVIETNVLVDIIAHRLHEWPAGRQMPEQRPSRVAEFAIDLAIAAGEQKQQHVARQVLHAVLQRIANLDVGQPVVLDQGIGAKHDATGWNDASCHRDCRTTSVYSQISTGGFTVSRSSQRIVGAREGWTYAISKTAVGSEKSKAASNPARIIMVLKHHSPPVRTGLARGKQIGRKAERRCRAHVLVCILIVFSGRGNRASQRRRPEFRPLGGKRLINSSRLTLSRKHPILTQAAVLSYSYVSRHACGASETHLPARADNRRLFLL